MTLQEAVSKLDPANDDHWTKSGLPSMEALEEMVGDNGIRRSDVEEVAPGFKRPEFHPANRPTKSDGVDTVTTTAELNAAREEKRTVHAAVVAIRTGYYGGLLRPVGKKFMFTGIPGTWMVCNDPEGKAEVEDALLVEQQGVQVGVSV